jgi:predicted aminopeptidase
VPRALLLFLLVLVSSSSGCFGARYVAQAAYGQLELLGYSRPVAQVLQDPRTDPRTAALLLESRAILTFAGQNGLPSHGNYRRFVELDRNQVVWFVTASRPLAFAAKIWRFPIAGSFPYLGWFELEAARRHRDELMADGWDVYMRPVRAYSTGGWFRDPILSTMLLPGDNAVSYLSEVLLHELVHANVLVRDQAVYNESVASFIGDGLAAAYLAERFGSTSKELARYCELLDEERRSGERMARAYAELDALYRSAATPAEKQAGKDRITEELQTELHLLRRPNNASLQGFKTYHAGHEALVALFASQGSWPRFIAAVKGVPRRAFTRPHQTELDDVFRGLAPRGGAPAAEAAGDACLRLRARKS